MSATTWPKAAANRQLVVNDDLQAPIYYIWPTQVNFQVPSNAPVGAVRIAVRTADTGELVAGGSFLVSAAAPGIFTANSGRHRAGGSTQPGLHDQFDLESGAGRVDRFDLRHRTGAGESRGGRRDGGGSSPLSNTVAVPTSSGTTCSNSQPSMCVAIGNGFGRCKVFGPGARLHRTVADQRIDSARRDGRGADPRGNQRDARAIP